MIFGLDNMKTDILIKKILIAVMLLLASGIPAYEVGGFSLFTFVGVVMFVIFDIWFFDLFA